MLQPGERSRDSFPAEGRRPRVRGTASNPTPLVTQERKLRPAGTGCASALMSSHRGLLLERRVARGRAGTDVHYELARPGQDRVMGGEPHGAQVVQDD